MAQIKLDGDFPINDTKNACEQKQRKGFRFTAIQAKTETALGQTVKVNVTDFERALAPDIFDELTFVPAKAADKLDDIKKAQSGLTFIFDAPECFVEGKKERRVVFGKKSPV